MKKFVGLVAVVIFSLLFVSSSAQAAGKVSVGNTLDNVWGSICVQIQKVVDVVLCDQDADRNQTSSGKIIYDSSNSGDDDDAWADKRPIPEPGGDDDVWSGKRP